MNESVFDKISAAYYELTAAEKKTADFIMANQGRSQYLSIAELAEYSGYDHNFCLNDGTAAQLYCPESGICMDTETTLPGLQVYTAGFLTERQGKDGAVYGKHHGVCLETQFWPDAVHHENFPSPILRAGEVYRHKTVYRFSLKAE